MVSDYNGTKEGLALNSWKVEILNEIFSIIDENAVCEEEAFNILEENLFNSIDYFKGGKSGWWVEACQRQDMDGAYLLGCAIATTGIIGPVYTEKRKELFGDIQTMEEMFVPAYIVVLSSRGFSSGLLHLLNCVRF